MPIENIFAPYAQRVRSVDEIQQGQAANALAQAQLQNNALAAFKQQRDLQTENALRQAVQQSNGDPTALRAAIVQSGNAAALDKHDQGQATIAKDAASASASTAQAGNHTADTRLKNMDVLTRQFAAVDPMDNNALASVLAQSVKLGINTAEQATSEADKVQKMAPDDRLRWYAAQVQQGMSVKDQMAQSLQRDTLKETARGHDLTYSASRENNADTIKKDYGVAGIQSSTSRANNAATIAKDFKVAGLDPQTGNFTGGNDVLNGLIDGIGQGKLPESTALSRVPPGMKAQIMTEVMKKYPDYDPTTIATRQSANKAFTTGPQGNAMRSFAVAGQHLSQLNGLIDAMDNGNIPLVNKIANTVAQQTGSTAPTNFDAVKGVVSQEVTKAIVGSPGGVEERQHLQQLLDNAKTTKQLKGIVQQYSGLMAAQHGALLQQRDAAGLPRSTLPNYGDGAEAAHPPDIQNLLDKYKVPGAK